MGLARLEVRPFLRNFADASPVLLLMQVAPEVYHLRLQKRQYGLDEQEAYHLHLRASRSLTRLWLVRKTRQIQHNVSHCGVLSWRGFPIKLLSQSWQTQRTYCKGKILS